MELKQGDCIELMKELKDESVDCIITDPPYNINQAEWDNKNDTELKEFTASYLQEFKRVIRKQKPILIFYTSGENFAQFFNIASGILNFKKLMFLYKPNDCSMPLISVLRKSEALTLWNSGGTIQYESEENTHDVIIQNVKVERGFYHPSVKNINTIRKVVKSFTKENDVILDPFMGSGTTGIACKQTKRNFIGYELNKEYMEIAEKRLGQVQLL